MWGKIKLVFSVIGAIVVDIINDIRYRPKYVIFEASFIENENLDLLHDPEDGYWVEVEEHQKTIDVVFYRSSTDRMRISPSMIKHGYTFIKSQLKPETLDKLRTLIRR